MLSPRVGERVLPMAAHGGARPDNREARAAFGGGTRMLNAAEVEAPPGHPVGGVRPFGLATPLPV